MMTAPQLDDAGFTADGEAVYEPGGWQPVEYVTEVEPPEKLRELQALHSLALPDPEPGVYENWLASHPDACPCNESEAEAE